MLAHSTTALVIQILVTVFGLVIIFKAFGNLKKATISLATFAIWSFFWLLIVIMFWQPNLTNYIAAVLQVGRGTDAVTYVSFVLLFYLFFKVFVSMEKQQQETTKLAREMAILSHHVKELKSR